MINKAAKILSRGFCSAWSMPGNDEATRLNNCTTHTVDMSLSLMIHPLIQRNMVNYSHSVHLTLLHYIHGEYQH